MEIRRLTPADAEIISAIEEEIFPDPWKTSDIRSLISTEGAMCYTALSEGRIAAYIIGRVIAPEGEIYRIATRPEYRRRGIATRLIERLLREETPLGLESLFLEVRESNLPAVSLYTSLGFKTIGKRKNYYKNPTENAILMMLGEEI